MNGINETENYFDIDFFNGNQIRVFKDCSQIQIVNDFGDGDHEEDYVDTDKATMLQLQYVINKILG